MSSKRVEEATAAWLAADRLAREAEHLLTDLYHDFLQGAAQAPTAEDVGSVLALRHQAGSLLQAALRTRRDGERPACAAGLAQYDGSMHKVKEAYASWQAADQAAREAEVFLRLAWDQFEAGGDGPPTQDLLEAVGRLRAAANEKLTAVMLAMSAVNGRGPEH